MGATASRTEIKLKLYLIIVERYIIVLIDKFTIILKWNCIFSPKIKQKISMNMTDSDHCGKIVKMQLKNVQF